MVADILNRLRALANLFPDGEGPTFSPPASADEIEAFESAVRLPLPAELREFLAQCDAIVAMDVHNGYWIGGTAELARSVVRGDFSGTMDSGGERITVMPIATDGGGNAFFLTQADGRVWRWDHETGTLSAVADSFVGFLERVAQDWERAASGDADWEYLV
jgi:cell wall assembly regulator SMI1